MAKMHDMTGQRFGRLVAVRPTDKRVGSFVVWECRCDCGATKLIAGRDFRRGLTRSCGCLRREVTIARMETHRLGGTPEHKSWSHMLYRCTNPSSRNWARYGGRGITVCKRWRKFENFLADMGPRPPGTTLDRIDNNGDYEPGNCRWATQSQQQNNRTGNRLLTLNGQTMNVKQWAKHIGIGYSTLQRRLAKNWPLEKALVTKRYRRRPAGVGP